MIIAVGKATWIQSGAIVWCGKAAVCYGGGWGRWGPGFIKGEGPSVPSVVLGVRFTQRVLGDQRSGRHVHLDRFAYRGQLTEAAPPGWWRKEGWTVDSGNMFIFLFYFLANWSPTLAWQRASSSVVFVNVMVWSSQQLFHWWKKETLTSSGTYPWTWSKYKQEYGKISFKAHFYWYLLYNFCMWSRRRRLSCVCLCMYKAFMRLVWTLSSLKVAEARHAATASYASLLLSAVHNHTPLASQCQTFDPFYFAVHFQLPHNPTGIRLVNRCAGSSQLMLMSSSETPNHFHSPHDSRGGRKLTCCVQFYWKASFVL